MKFEAYPFEKLNRLLDGISPSQEFEELSLTIGEPQFETPEFIQNEFKNSSSLLKKYPKSSGELNLKEAIQGFIDRRFSLHVELNEIIPTFGTREVLFNFPQFLLFDIDEPVMAFTNPFYQIYEGAATASRAKIVHLNLTKENNFKPVIDECTLSSCHLVILNFPNNPTASSLSVDELAHWVELALKYDFVLLNDECYSEIYCDKRVPSLLEASKLAGNHSFKNVLVINSISKRSSAPGLRSGFIAGDAEILKEYMSYRTYVGCASPIPLQNSACVAWSDELHVEASREIYKKNFEIAKEILGVETPKSTFYIWLEIENALEFTQFLYKNYNLKVLPGEYLGRADKHGQNPGVGHIRLALVYDETKTKDALLRVKKALGEFSEKSN